MTGAAGRSAAELQAKGGRCSWSPSTLLRRHRELARRRWTYPLTGRRDPRALDPEVVQVVVRMADKGLKAFEESD
jgi:hypothetical protein